MLRLDIIQQNPAFASAITWFGVIVLALVAALTAGLWVVVARGRARRNAQDFDDSASDPGLEALRHERLVVRPSGAPGAVEVEIERTGESEPTDR
jgi:hypothetical protein